jgi:hypothetical protein
LIIPIDDILNKMKVLCGNDFIHQLVNGKISRKILTTTTPADDVLY